ncbi:ribosome biogenesis protein SLX9-domain-containing protein [Xylariomycetidae sp. FL2044]|nr:ribosome biogenesis protein SLX9-domain-containing protein [Xylariomycetidae sp. FL2044]
MAPVVPSKRRSLRTKLAAKSSAEPHAPRKAPHPDAAATSDSFINSKKDKRLVKHSSFVSRIEKKHIDTKKPLKRRRPSKKLVTNLDSLAKALPDLLEGEGADKRLKQLREGKIRHESLKSKPGALKKKEKLVKGEVKRFGQVLAALNAVGAANTTTADVPKSQPASQSAGAGDRTEPQEGGSISSRWSALRNSISTTMEQNPAFLNHQV